MFHFRNLNQTHKFTCPSDLEFATYIKVWEQLLENQRWVYPAFRFTRIQLFYISRVRENYVHVILDLNGTIWMITRLFCCCFPWHLWLIDLSFCLLRPAWMCSCNETVSSLCPPIRLGASWVTATWGGLCYRFQLGTRSMHPLPHPTYFRSLISKPLCKLQSSLTVPQRKPNFKLRGNAGR